MNHLNMLYKGIWDQNATIIAVQSMARKQSPEPLA